MKALRGSRLGVAALVVGVLVLGSVLVGVAWGLLAPAQHDLVLPSGDTLPLTGESLHRFDAAAMLACAGLIVGVVGSAAVWALRWARGPLTLAGLVIGSVVGSFAMAGTGVGVAALRVSRPAEPGAGEVIAVAPGIGSLLVLIFQPLAACVVTLVLAALNPYDDLGVDDPDGDSVQGDAQTGESLTWEAEAQRTRP